MIVSAAATAQLRSDVADGLRPCPEFLRLEAAHGVRLVDWSQVARGRGRSATHTIFHVIAVARRLSGTRAVLSDSEHIGIPLACVLAAMRSPARHMLIAHRPTRRVKAWLLRTVASHRIDRIVVHSHDQLTTLRRGFKWPEGRTAVVPYGVDTEFWSPQDVVEGDYVLSVGREHRDHRTLTAACESVASRVIITDGSSHSPGAHRWQPKAWPSNVECRSMSFLELRQTYAGAAVVVVPLVPTDFPAGITALLEAMAMGKAVIVSATDGLRGIVRDGVDGILVQPRDVPGLRAAVRRLLEHPEERRRLGAEARRTVLDGHSLSGYVTAIVRNLDEMGPQPDSLEAS